MQHSASSLSQLSHAEKDALILLLQGQIAALQEAVAQLQARLNMNRRNSSKPPCSDGLIPMSVQDETNYGMLHAYINSWSLSWRDLVC